jgi:cytochrome c-type biogenesis protein CcmH/NrfF
LAVLDGLAVGLGWALPVLVLLALVGLAALWVVRRRRHVVTPA